MAKHIHGQLTLASQRFALVVSRFNEFITGRLLDGAVDCLKRHGCADENITCVHVPGAFEIPVTVKRLVDAGGFEAIICLGCVIRGQTPHFDYVAGEAAKGIGQLALSSGLPISFGVVTADSLEQAIDRAAGKMGNKGVDAAMSAIEMVNVFAQLPARGRTP